MILLIDNYDSFTWNLVQAFRVLSAEVEVHRNDAIDLPEIRRRKPRAIVLSPGPGRPEDAGITPIVARSVTEIPVLGVCLGHQALGEAFGATLVRAPQPVHGKMSHIAHTGLGLFAGLEQPLAVGRYHSLILDRETVSDDLQITAWTASGLVMAMEHRRLPLWGVQFHPESILTPSGNRIVANFLRLVDARH